MRWMVYRFLVSAVLVIASCGCSSMGGGPRASQNSFSSVVDYYPLGVGAAWVYQVHIEGKDEPANMQVLVSGLSGDKNSERQIYLLSILDESLPPESRIDEPVSYEVRNTEGIYCLKCGGFLLKGPIAIGNEWPAGQEKTSARYRITSTDATVDVDGKNIHECLAIELIDLIQGRRIEFFYAPNVGPVLVRYFRFGNGTQQITPYRVEKFVEFGRMTPPRFLRQRQNK